MCIAVKIDKNYKLDKSYLAAWMRANDDGASWTWWDDKGQLCYRKGITSIDEAWELYNEIDKFHSNKLFHARIASVGQPTPELCHPFRLTRDISKMKRLEGTGIQACMIHNGPRLSVEILPGCSDTMSLDGLIVAPLFKKYGANWLDNKHNMEILKSHMTKSDKIAIAYANGRIDMVGDGWSEYEPGLWVSNTHWAYYIGIDSIYEDDSYWYGSYYYNYNTKKSSKKNKKSGYKDYRKQDDYGYFYNPYYYRDTETNCVYSFETWSEYKVFKDKKEAEKKAAYEALKAEQEYCAWVHMLEEDRAKKRGEIYKNSRK